MAQKSVGTYHGIGLRLLVNTWASQIEEKVVNFEGVPLLTFHKVVYKTEYISINLMQICISTQVDNTIIITCMLDKSSHCLANFLTRSQ